MDKPDRIARKLATIRARRKLSLRELASASGVAHSTINGIELGKHGAGLETWHKLSRALGVELKEFVPLLRTG